MNKTYTLIEQLLSNFEHMNPKISVIITCYNYGAFLEDAVSSVLDQTFKDFEIIIVNDGSTDKNTLDTLDRIKNKYPEIVIIHQKNGHISNARNNGIKASRGEFYMTLDADDTIAPTMLEECFNYIVKNENIGFVYTHVRFFGRVNFIWRNLEYNFYDLLFFNQPTVCALVRRKAWEEAGGYDENMKTGYEDWEFWINLGKNGWHGKLLNKALFNYRKHGISFIYSADLNGKKNISYIKEKHKDIYSEAEMIKLRRQWKSENLIIKFYKKIIRELSTVKLKLYLAGLLNLDMWKKHPLEALSRCVPVRIKKIANKIIGKKYFRTDYFGENI